MLNRCRILVVEDEYMLAQDLRNELEEAGAVVLGPEPSVDRAMTRLELERRVDAAVLDVNLSGEEVFPVADALAMRRIPFLFTTGYKDEIVKKRFPEAVTCEKPYERLRLLTALEELVSADQL